MLGKGALLSQETWEWGCLVQFGEVAKHTKAEGWPPSRAWGFLCARHAGENEVCSLPSRYQGPGGLCLSWKE